MRKKKIRLDEYLIGEKLVGDKHEAFVIVTEGRVFVDWQKAISPAQLISPDTKIEIKRAKEFVGRGALKLQAALEKFRISLKGKICADVGAATGGFTQILLNHGARKVYAIDTARGKLDLKLRADPRIVIMERTDIRDIEALPDAIDLVTIDVSLISLRDILTHVKQFLTKKGDVVALFKPHYEARDPSLLHRGVIRDSYARERLLGDFMEWAEKNGWNIAQRIESPIRGREGNVEYLLHLTPDT